MSKGLGVTCSFGQAEAIFEAESGRLEESFFSTYPLILTY